MDIEKDIEKELDLFLDENNKKSDEKDENECIIKCNGELIERVEKKFIVEDGRQLLI